MNIEKYTNNIPKEMQGLNQWLCFRVEKIQNRNGKNLLKKLPFSPKTFSSKEWNKKENWSSFIEVLEVVKAGKCDGISFVLTEEDPYICVDLDDVTESRKQDFLKSFADTYVETSYSGKGLHIFLKGSIEKGFNNQSEKVEMYKSNKCIAMTGDLLTCNSVANKQNQLDKAYQSFASKKSTLSKIDSFKTQNTAYMGQDDIPCASEIIEIMCKVNEKARNLFYGMYSTGDASRDDFQMLLFLNSFTHGNHALMKEIFLASALNKSNRR